MTLKEHKMLHLEQKLRGSGRFQTAGQDFKED